MKFISKIFFLLAAALTTTACVDKEADYISIPEEDVNFTYSVAGDQYTLDYYVVSSIQFTNTSAKTGSFVWDFGDGTTSNEANPVHKYSKAGIYNVKLTLDGVGYKE